MAKKTSLPLAKVYQFVEPGPVAMVPTATAKRTNIMTRSWHMMIDFKPLLIACVISSNSAATQGKYSVEIEKAELPLLEREHV